MSQINHNKLIIVISSPSGAGKTSVCRKILDNDNSIGLSISDTTREARDNEIDGKDYNFINEEQFKYRIKKGDYIEYARVFGNYYGSLYSNISSYFENGMDVLFDIDWQGADQLRKSNYKNILTIFIVPPSKEAIYDRLKIRAKTSGDDEGSINNRMKAFETEMSHKEDYDFIVINENLDICAQKIIQIIEEYRKKLTN